MRANIDRKSAFLKRADQFRPNFHVKGDVFHQPLIAARIDRVGPNNERLTTLSLTVFTQRNLLADFLPEKCTFLIALKINGLYIKRYVNSYVYLFYFDPPPSPPAFLWGRLRGNVQCSS